jgi:hypothetical protein
VTANLSIADQLLVYAARRAFDLARRRYVRTRTAERAAFRLRSLQSERSSLEAAVARLRAVLDFHSVRLFRARDAFEREFPNRRWGTAGERSTLFRRLVSFGHGERLHRELRVWLFCRDEAAAELRMCQLRLDVVKREMAVVVANHQEYVERRLDTPAGLREALAADPQFALARARLAWSVDNGDNR